MSLARLGGCLKLSVTQSARIRPQVFQVAVYQRATWRPQARFASTLPNEPSVSQMTRASLLEMPSKESLIEMEQDESVLLTADQALINITPRAAERLRLISTKENDPNIALRVAVESGGCHGYQYKMELTSKRQLDDYHFSHPLVAPSNVVIDVMSMDLLKGSTVDFATELIGSSFRITNNPQAKGNGCGCGVSWEAKF